MGLWALKNLFDLCLSFFHIQIALFFLVFITEVKLSELSEVVGNYEKLRLQDQQAIQKLKDRLQQLDVENATLTRQISVDENHTPDNERDVVDDETSEELKKQVMKLKGLLKIALDSSDKPLDLGMDQEFTDKRCGIFLIKLCLESEKDLQRNLKGKSLNEI